MSPRALVIVLAAPIFTIATPANANPSSTDQLEADIPITAPWFEPRVTDRAPTRAGLFHNPGVLFINFDGAEMQSCGGSDYSVNNCSSIMNDTVLPYSGGETQRAAVVQAMAGDVSDFAVTVVAERPPDDTDYDMVMVGNWDPPPEEGGFAGVAPTIDCWNDNRSETSFSLDLGSASVIAKIVGQEAAHVWGLEHVDSPNDLLFPTTGGAADPAFENACQQIVVIDGGIVPTTANCSDMHAVNCPDQPDHQNSYLDMMMVFGPPDPDMVAPTLEILEPEEGQVFPSGADVELRIRMIDNIAPPLFDVFASVDADEMGESVGGSNKDYLGPELVLPINGLPDGEHFVRVDVSDQDLNFAPAATVNFIVGEDVVPSDDDGDGDEAEGDDGDGDGEADAGTGSGDDGGSDGGSDEGDGSAADGSDEGCGCQSRPRSGWLPLMLLIFARRRRD